MKTINSLILVIVLIVMLASPQMNVSAADVLTWESRQDMPTARYSMGAAISGGKIYVIGGDNWNCTPLTNVEEYDPTTGSWSTRADMPTGRWGLGVATGGDGKIYAIGGAGGSCGSEVLSTVEVYDPTTDSWAARANMPTSRWEFKAVTATNGKIYAFGGQNSGGWLPTVEEYDPSTDTWVTKNNMPWPNKNFAITASNNGKIYILGGDADTTSLLEYDPTFDTWTSRASNPSPRSGMGMAEAANGRIYVISGDLQTTVNSYNPENNSWSMENGISVPRTGHGVVTIGDTIYVLGGWGGSGPISSVEAGTVTPVPPPANDNFSNATAFDALPFSDTVDTTSASLEPGESQYCDSSPRTVWYKFTPATNIEIRVNTEGSPFNDTSITAYQDTGTGLEGLNAFTCTSWGGPLTFNAQAGVTYYFQAGYISSIGALRLNFQEVPPPLNDNFANATVISSPLPFDETVDAAGATAEAGEPASSCAVAGYGGPYKSIWYAYTPTASGMVSATVPMAVFAPVLAAFTGDSLNNLTELGCQVFSGNSLTFPVEGGTTYYFQVSKYTTWDPDGSVQFQLRELNPPANDSFSNAAVIGTLPFSNMVDINDATVEPYEPQYCNSSPKTVWYSFTTNTDMLVQVDMSGSSFWDTTFTVYQAYGPNITDLSYVQCASFGNFARFTAQAGMTYYIQAGSVYGSGVSLQLNLNEILRPANDDFATAKIVSSTPYNDSVDITEATIESGEPQSCYYSYKTVWYAFTPTTDMLVQADMFGSSFYDTILNVYQANGPGMETLSFLQCAYYGSSLKFNAKAGVTYYIQAGSIYSSGGDLHLNLQELIRPANDDFANAKAIDTLPYNNEVDISNATIEAGEPTGCYWSSKTVWYTFTPGTNMLIQVDTSGSSFYDSFFNFYQSTGPGFNGLTHLQCASYGNPLMLTLQAGVTYYIQAGSMYGSGGTLHLHVQELPRPANDDFANAKAVQTIPFDDTVDTNYATGEINEPIPSCAYNTLTPLTHTVWYAFTPTETGSISASVLGTPFTPIIAAYTGSSLSTLTQVWCVGYDRNILTIHVNAGTTYYFQIGNYYDWVSGGEVQFHVEPAPQPVAGFYYSPQDPSIYDTVQFCDSSYDPGWAPIGRYDWDFGDGTTTSAITCPSHKYAKDGDYTVQLGITTIDGRTASASQVIQVRTRDVAITKLSAAQSASAGQTRTITVSLNSKTYQETVQVDLYRSGPGGFVLVKSITQTVPAYNANRTVAYNFNYTFTSSDASIGKVTFYAVATIVNGRDSYPADNEAYSIPTKVNKRK